jgi:hypothetical protein
MSEPSPRYIAEHFLLPRFLAACGGGAMLDAMEKRDADFFIPVWMKAGFRFTPILFCSTVGPWRIGVMTFPQPQGMTEAYLGVVIGRTDDPQFGRLFLWEESISFVEGGTKPSTVIGEWRDGTHVNYGSGPSFNGDLAGDTKALVKMILAIVERQAT